MNYQSISTCICECGTPSWACSCWLTESATFGISSLSWAWVPHLEFQVKLSSTKVMTELGNKKRAIKLYYKFRIKSSILKLMCSIWKSHKKGHLSTLLVCDHQAHFLLITTQSDEESWWSWLCSEESHWLGRTGKGVGKWWLHSTLEVGSYQWADSVGQAARIWLGFEPDGTS